MIFCILASLRSTQCRKFFIPCKSPYFFLDVLNFYLTLSRINDKFYTQRNTINNNSKLTIEVFRVEYTYSISFFLIRYSVFNLRNLLFSIRYSMFNIRYLVFNIRYSVFNIRYSVFNIRYSVFNIRYSVFNIRYLVFNIR